jgi:predicted  nucleic acid-binding Zn-ribbon protein
MQSLDTSLGNLNTAIQRKNQQGENYVNMVNALIEEITNFLNGLQQNNDTSAALQQQLNAANAEIRRLTEENARTQEQLRAVQDRANAFEEQIRQANEELNQLRQNGQGNAAQIQKLQQDVANAQQVIDQTNAERAELLKQLEERTGRIQQNVDQIAQMHINKEDSDELTANSQRLRALIAGLVAARGAGGPGAGADAGAGAGVPAVRVARAPNTALGQTAPVIIPRDQNGGKTKRRRGKKSMYRGGYVEKLRAKKTRKRARTSKRRKSTASFSSSSSASSNSRQKSTQGRKM